MKKKKPEKNKLEKQEMLTQMNLAADALKFFAVYLNFLQLEYKKLNTKKG